MDHASIATEVKVVEKIRNEEGKTKEELGREEFLKRAWDWALTYKDRIREQVKKLGASCDWDRERFTMDEGCSEAVKETFVRLYEEGLIYKGSRIINWCPRRFLETFIFILAFASLRRYTGGYHAKTDIGCYGLTTISLVIYLVLLQYTPFSHQLMFIWFNLIVYWLAVFFIAPVTSDQKPINAIQLSRIKKHMWIISVAVTILCVIGTLASKGLKLSYMLSLVSILVAISIFATSMMKVFKKTDTRR